jgi:major membrane immunogen (membrane-anchored lipoprotein)
MSRSYRHSPFMGHCSHSDKPGKILANRALRAATRQAFNDCRDFDHFIAPLLREVSNVWSFPKDGKGRIKKSWADYAKYMRK